MRRHEPAPTCFKRQDLLAEVMGKAVPCCGAGRSGDQWARAQSQYLRVFMWANERLGVYLQPSEAPPLSSIIWNCKQSSAFKFEVSLAIPH